MSEKKLPTEIFVKRNKPNILTLGITSDMKVTIFPGITKIEDPGVIKRLHDEKFNKAWKALIENGVHEIVTGVEGSRKKDTKVFTAMDVKKALEIVNETYSVPALEKLYADEKSKKARTTVLGAIEDQIKQVKSQD